MGQEYRIIIKNERFAQVRLFRLVLCTVFAIIFTVAAYYRNDLYLFIWPALLCFNIFFSINRADFLRYKLFRISAFPEFGFLWAIAGAWFLLTWWLALLVLLIALLHFFIKPQYEILVDANKVCIKAQMVKNISWQSLQNIILKDELLTIDYKDNRILQAEIIPLLSNIGNEQDFNEFCRLQLQAHL